ncbi:MAG: dTMP kinase [Methylacidiphilales bacterium]|nr:dTMP kinase [Candidatus Methylacidiphilales bacterium]MDW8349648.1 dTMP kinase [Verrucomicrobiae bacterium]
MTNPLRFITFEGTEASGKSTQSHLLKKRLEDLGHTVILCREPGGTALGEQIRHLLKHSREGIGMCPETELLLFAASRAQLIHETIIPALKKNHWVICDRFADSSIVYQGIGRSLPLATVDTINQFATQNLVPTLTFLLDISLKEAQARLHLRTHSEANQFDRMEDQSSRFFEQIISGYRQLAQAHPQRIKIIPASPPPPIVAENIWQHVSHAFSL